MKTASTSGLTRRKALKGAVAAVGTSLLAPGRSAATAVAQTIRAVPAHARLLPGDSAATAVWSYDGSVPAPEIRLPQGARLTRRLVNQLDAATSIHWHGLRPPNAMDGVPGLTQQAVAPGAVFLYDFDLEDAGTYWFHSHNKSYEQVARGLYGALVVTESDPPDVDRDVLLLIDDWRLDPETLQIDESFGAPHDLAHGGRIGNVATTNSQVDFALPVTRHERLRIRLINTAGARVFDLALRDLAGWLVALDGMPLDSPVAVPEVLTLAPGQRADLIVDVTAEEGAEAYLVHIVRGEGYSQARFPVAGSASAARRGAPGALPPNPLTAVGPAAAATPARLLMEGGAMGGMASATLDGRVQDMRSLAQAGQFWAFNGVVGLTDTPLVQAAPGETVLLSMENRTAFAHAMHLHGHHMREVLGDGTLGPWRDTLLLGSGEAREVLFVGGGAGRWAFHCHMLSHAAAGMMSWIEVAT